MNNSMKKLNGAKLWKYVRKFKVYSQQIRYKIKSVDYYFSLYCLLHCVIYDRTDRFCFPGVKPYACSECDRSFTQRCSLESHCRKVHNMDITYAYKQRRNKIYVCEECGHSTADASQHFVHLRENHPNNPALTKCHDRRQFKFCGENQQNVHLPRTWWRIWNFNPQAYPSEKKLL